MKDKELEKILTVEIAKGLFNEMCCNEKYKDIYDKTTSKITNIVADAIDEYPLEEDYILSEKKETNEE